MTRMLGAWSRPWCPHCHAPAGEDCPSRSWSRKTQRARENRAWRRAVWVVGGAGVFGLTVLFQHLGWYPR